MFLIYLNCGMCLIYDFRLAEAEGTLMGGSVFKQKSLDDLVAEYGDAAAFALVLLGQVYMQTERKTKAADALHRALKLNPFMWSAFEMLCGLGEKPDAESIFQLDNLEDFSHCHGVNPIAALIGTQTNHFHSEGIKTKAHINLEPMLIDQSCTPTPQIAGAAVGSVNTRFVRVKSKIDFLYR